MANLSLHTFCQEKRAEPEGNYKAHLGILLDSQEPLEISLFRTIYSTQAHPLSDLSFAPKETKLLNIPWIADLCNRIFHQ